MPHPLSAADEQKIMSSLNDISGLVANGSAPNDAIVKIAGDIGLQPGHISLVVNAYNTGATNVNREDGNDVFAKAANFELADTATILEELYPTNVKTSAQLVKSVVVSDDYDVSPGGWQKRQKVANAATRILPPLIDPNTNKPVTKVAAYPGDPQRPALLARNSVLAGRRNLEEGRRVKSASADALRHSFSDLCYFFRQYGRPSFGDVIKNAGVFFGGDGTTVMNAVAAQTPGLRYHDEKPRGESHSMLDEVYTKISSVIAATKAYKDQVTTFTQLEQSTKKATEDTIRPFLYPHFQSVLTPSSEKAAGGLGMGLAASMLHRAFSRPSNPDMAPAVQKYVRQATDPAHEDELRRIKAQAMLSSLMAGDEVISGYDHEEVLDAYNDIAALSPRAADNKLLMQALLRKQLTQGAQDPMDLDQMLGMEEKMRKRDTGIEVPPSTDLAEIPQITRKTGPISTLIGRDPDPQDAQEARHKGQLSVLEEEAKHTARSQSSVLPPKPDKPDQSDKPDKPDKPDPAPAP